jgi:ADP-heptose:LPS heptosyltransferase
MSSALVIAYVRLGDLAQMSPGLQLLRQQGVVVTLYVASDYVEFCRAYIPCDFVTENWLEIENKKFDLVINLSFHGRFIHLAESIKAGIKIHLGANQIKDARSKWYSLLCAVVPFRITSVFHITELFTGVLTGGLSVSKVTIARKISKKGNPILVGITLGASDSIRAWTTNGWVETIHGIHNLFDADIVLLGSNEENVSAQKIISSCRAPLWLTSKVGKTSLVELAQIISNCDLVVGGDTGPPHLACAMEIPTVMLMVGPAYAYTTGPWREGDCALLPVEVTCYPCKYGKSCGTQECKQKITPSRVTIACETRLNFTDRESCLIGDSHRLICRMQPSGLVYRNSLFLGGKEWSREIFKNAWAICNKSLPGEMPPLIDSGELDNEIIKVCLLLGMLAETIEIIDGTLHTGINIDNYNRISDLVDRICITLKETSFGEIFSAFISTRLRCSRDKSFVEVLGLSRQVFCFLGSILNTWKGLALKEIRIESNNIYSGF